MQLLLQVIVFQPLYNALAIFISLFKGNLGIAILILSFVIRLVIWPQYREAMTGQRKLAKLQPKIKALQKEHKDNPAEGNKALMALLKEENIHPFSSFGFIFLQLIIFIILYAFIFQFLKGGWGNNLYSFISQPSTINFNFLSFDLRQPSLILTLISAGLNSLVILIQPPIENAQGKEQNKLLTVSLPFMVVLFYKKFPGAIVIYWLGISLIGMIQEFLMAKQKKAQVKQINGDTGK